MKKLFAKYKNLTLSFVLLPCLFLPVSVQAQQELTLYFMNRVGQATTTNPALFPRNNFYFALPPSIVFNFATTGFTYNELFKYSGDSIDLGKNFLDLYNNRLKKMNYIFMDVNVDLLNAGFRINPWKMHFLLNVTEKINFRFKYHKDFFGFFTLGNGYFVEEDANLDFALEGLHYREYGFTAGYTHYEKFAAGIKIKRLQGLGNLSTEQTEIIGATDTADFIQFAGTTNYKFNLSGIQVYTTQQGQADSIVTPDPDEYLFNFGNSGWAFDIGGSYTFKLPVFKNKITVAASVLDLGFIEWKTNVTNLHSNGVYATAGIDFVNAVDSSNQFSIQGVYDTLDARFRFKKSYDTYKTSMIAKAYVSARLALDTNSNIGLLFFGEFFEGLKPAFTLEYDRTFGKKKKHTFVLTYSYKNRSFLNIGLGWQFKFGPMQFFACGDNLSAYFIPKDTKSFNLRFGMNLLIGKSKFPEPKKKEGGDLL